MPKAALVWLDNSTAKIFEFAGEAVERRVCHRHEQQALRRLAGDESLGGWRAA